MTSQQKTIHVIILQCCRGGAKAERKKIEEATTIHVDEIWSVFKNKKKKKNVRKYAATAAKLAISHMWLASHRRVLSIDENMLTLFVYIEMIIADLSFSRFLSSTWKSQRIWMVYTVQCTLGMIYNIPKEKIPIFVIFLGVYDLCY